MASVYRSLLDWGVVFEDPHSKGFSNPNTMWGYCSENIQVFVLPHMHIEFGWYVLRRFILCDDLGSFSEKRLRDSKLAFMASELCPARFSELQNVADCSSALVELWSSVGDLKTLPLAHQKLLQSIKGGSKKRRCAPRVNQSVNEIIPTMAGVSNTSSLPFVIVTPF